MASPSILILTSGLGRTAISVPEKIVTFHVSEYSSPSHPFHSAPTVDVDTRMALKSGCPSPLMSPILVTGAPVMGGILGVANVVPVVRAAQLVSVIALMVNQNNHWIIRNQWLQADLLV